MAGGWGSAKNGIRIGVFWSGFEYRNNGTEARIVGAYVAIDRGISITDSSNKLTVAGTAVNDQSWSNINVSGAGEMKLKDVVGTWKTLGPSSFTEDFQAKFEGINSAGGDLTVSKDVAFPVLVETPLPPFIQPGASGLVNATGNNIRITWFPTFYPQAPVVSWAVFRQMDNETTWTQVSTSIPVGTIQWTDTTTLSNHRYRYAVRASNVAGNSSLSTPSPYYATQPIAPSGVGVVRSGVNLVLSWANAATYRTGSQIERSDGGGAFALKNSPTAATTSWTDTSPFAGTNQYRIRHVIAGVPLADGTTVTLYSGWALSTVIQPSAPPNAPTVEVSPSAFDPATAAVIISWVHNPVDGSVQTEAEVRWRISPAGAWTTVSKTIQTSHVISSGTLTTNSVYEAQVRTKGSNASFGAWRDPGPTFRTVTTPVVTLVVPESGAVVTSAQVTMLATIVTLDGAASGELELIKDGDVVYSETFSGDVFGTYYLITFKLDDNSTYTLRVRGSDEYGLTSAWASHTFTTDFRYPALGTITHAECDLDKGSIALDYTTMYPEGTELAPTSMLVERLTPTPDGGEVWVPICLFDGIALDVLRTNYYPNPQLVGSGWDTGVQARYTWNLQWVSGLTPPSGIPEGVGVRAVCPSSGSGAFRGIDLAGDPIAGSPPDESHMIYLGELPEGAWVTPSAWIVSSRASVGHMIAIRWANSAGWVGATVQSSTSSVAGGVWVRKSLSVQKPAGATHLAISMICLPSINWVSGDTITVTGALVEPTNTEEPWFSGDYSPDAGLLSGWYGSVDASVNVLGTRQSLTCVDLIPQIGRSVQYRVTTEAQGLSVEGPIFSAGCLLSADECVYPHGMRIYLNGTADTPDAVPYGESAMIIGEIAASEDVTREKALITPVGRVLPIELRGRMRTETYTISGVVARDDLVPGYLSKLGVLRDRWKAIAQLGAPLCYRDPFGTRLFVSIGGVSTSWSFNPVTPVSAQLTRVSGGDVGDPSSGLDEFSPEEEPLP